VTIDDFWSIQEYIFKNCCGHTLPKGLLNWILYRHYPVLKWTQESPSQGKLTQHFNTFSYGKWWIPTSLVTETSLHKNNINVWLTAEKPYFLTNHSFEDWIMVDIQQAGKNLL